MMILFIDTNVFLSFYHFTSDDLGELDKLRVLIKNKRLKLLLPDQVIDEFRRNREGRINDALKVFREVNLNLPYPNLTKSYPQYEELRKLQRGYEEAHSSLVASITSDARNLNLAADNTIEGIFDAGTRIEVTDEIVERSRKRIALGNPPGKAGLGDAVNWEALLKEAPEKTDLFFVSGDKKDYASPLDGSSLNAFLVFEWKSVKESAIRYYRTVGALFSEHFPEIKLVTDMEKDLLIKELAASRSYAETHRVLGELSRFSDFTPSEVNAMVTAANANNQIWTIIGDADVNAFYKRLVAQYAKDIEPDNLAKLQELFDAVPNVR